MRVLQSFPEGRSTTNPYLLQLNRSLRPHVDVQGFTWRRALTGRYDVFHVHWPEIMLSGRTPSRALAKRLLFRLLLTRLRLRRTAVVRTVHNVRSHESQGRRNERLLRQFDRQTTLWIRLNPFTPVPIDSPVCTIPHGHYRQWYAQYPSGAFTPGRLLYFGLIRPYKGVGALIHSFRQSEIKAVDSVEPSLHIVGAPQSEELAESVKRAAAGDERIVCALGHASDSELVQEIFAAELVVLPYAEMHNSGAALLALSLNRPVLVPRNVVTTALADEAGNNWVLTYDGPLTAESLALALTRTRQTRGSSAPDLSHREWATGASDHVEAYKRARRTLR